MKMGLTLDWIIGFFEGEGSFTYGIDGGKNKTPCFTVSQNEREIFEKIQKQLKIGRIYFKKGSGNSKDGWTFQVRGYDGL